MFYSLKRLLHSKADAFLSNDYYESDIAWMELVSGLVLTLFKYIIFHLYFPMF